MSPIEQQRLRPYMVSAFSTEQWRQLFSFLLGRHVTSQETSEFLIRESQRGADHSGRITSLCR